jgi:hypothetical protein
MSNPRLIYHFTHLRNLPQILADGALFADSLVHQTKKLSVEVGDLDVKSRRRSMLVACGPGGHPSDYVPFYFAPRSPMLYKINKGSVSQYQDGQEKLVYLVSDVDLIIASGLEWVFTDGNCANNLTEYFDDPAKLNDSVDWPLMKSTLWNNTAEDPDRMRRRMAEFLIHQHFPLDLLRGVATMTKEVSEEVKELFASSSRTMHVVIRRAWYY